MLILQVAFDMVKTMCAQAETQKLTTITLSDNTVKQIIDAIASSQKETGKKLKTPYHMLSKWKLAVRDNMPMH
jgi:hypothetical protein